MEVAGEEGDYIPIARYTVTTRMIPAFKKEKKRKSALNTRM